jgi:chemotaxis protein MotA
MLILVGAFIVLASTLGGFMLAGGHPLALMHISEFIIIAGAAIGAMVLMSPRKVLMDLVKQILSTFKGSPYTRHSYEDLFKSLHELFMLGRRSGMVALEEHVLNPETSTIFAKYPTFLKNHHAMEFLCNGLRPIIDGKIKPDQLKLLLEIELEAMEDEHEKPVGVLTKSADAMPGFGIVAAVLGIVITMASIAGPIELIGEKVAAALVGTFLGILMCYGVVGPLGASMTKGAEEQNAYLHVIRVIISGFLKGSPPILAIEMGRRAIPAYVRPGFDEMEKNCKSAAASATSSEAVADPALAMAEA